MGLLIPVGLVGVGAYMLTRPNKSTTNVLIGGACAVVGVYWFVK